MARITSADCKKVVHNCFELVLLASYRAKELSKGAKPTVERDNDKNAVIALREIAGKTVDAELLHGLYVQSLRKNANPDVVEDKTEETISEEAEMFEQTAPMAVDSEAVSIDNFVFEDEIEIDDDK